MTNKFFLRGAKDPSFGISSLSEFKMSSKAYEVASDLLSFSASLNSLSPLHTCSSMLSSFGVINGRGGLCGVDASFGTETAERGNLMEGPL
jgi:hypothetical protein